MYSGNINHDIAEHFYSERLLLDEPQHECIICNEKVHECRIVDNEEKFCNTCFPKYKAFYKGLGLTDIEINQLKIK
jgi:hypothetical protein